MLVGVQRLCRVFVVAVVYGSSTILRFSSPLSFVNQSFFLNPLFFSVPSLHSYSIAFMLLFDPRLPFLEFHKVRLNRLLRLLNVGFEGRIFIIRVLRKFAQNQLRMSIKVQVSPLHVSILFADGCFR